MADWPIFENSGYIEGITSSAASPASANTKGTWYEAIAATEKDTIAVHINIGRHFASWVGECLVDLGVGPSGSEEAVVSNMLYSASGATAGFNYLFPLRIPAGSRICTRGQANDSAARGINVGTNLIYGSFLSNSGGAIVTTYGADTSDSGGVLVDPGGTANTKGSWYEITGSTTRKVNYFNLAIGNQGNTDRSRCYWLVDVGIGSAGNEVVIAKDLSLVGGEGENLNPSVFSIPVAIPAGVRIAVRAECTITDATDRKFDAALYCMS